MMYYLFTYGFALLSATILRASGVLRVASLLSPSVPRTLIEEFAEELHMSAATAKADVSRLFSTLGARDRAQLVVIAHETGLALSS